MEEGGNGKEILAEEEKGKARRSRRWKGTERDSKGAGTSKEKRKMEEEGNQRERKKKCMLVQEPRKENLEARGFMEKRRQSQEK